MDFDPIMHDTLWMSVVGQAFIVLGSLIFLSATVGITRFPDLYTRSSAVATATGLGVSFVLTGAFFFLPGVENAVKLIVAVVLQLVTSAVGSMALARSGYLIGSAVYSPTHHNELEERTEDEAGRPGEDVRP
ncbi:MULTISPECIES: monovalent cation/H(+) antiporter subunit G [Kocuria]|nr:MULTISPECIES: monovalent cation/H(+) antiporter subunit G [Kocuria]WIG17386.1 monovalent cation/H(+) antiporter subunit G [Kocuria rosea]STX03771.1 Multiple resistance and pH homeostasis protein G [Kocuria rosea]STX07281.1 Multiple resistance and pH homeostasis protein G [Kocuria rosea]VEH41433.1 Multiple resistance and pH homeostasis protein G [Kocuria rosea]